MPALLPGDWQGQHGSPLPLYKVILLARRSPVSTEPLTLGVFVVPSEAISFQHQSHESQVRLQGLEKLPELAFFLICMEPLASGISALWTPVSSWASRSSRCTSARDQGGLISAQTGKGHEKFEKCRD